MNLSDLEQRIKADFDESEFSPKEQEWKRMEGALKSRRSALLLLLPFHKAVVAAALVVVLGTAGLYLFFSRTEKDSIVSAPEQSKTSPAPLYTTPKIHKPEPETQPAYPHTGGIARQFIEPEQTETQTSPVLSGNHPDETVAKPIQKEEPQAIIQEQPLTANTHDSIRKRPFAPLTEQSGYTPYQVSSTGKHALRLGFAANVGKPSLGNVQYNVGVVARKNLSERFYAEANVSLSSSNVHYSEKGPEPPRPGLPSDGLGNVREAINLNFTNNIISVGIAPALGFKVAPKLSVSAGGDLYRALNRDLKPQFTIADYNYGDKSASYGNTPIPKRNITNWDFGLKAQVEYKVSRNFSLSTQYRQGLTQYILIDGKSLKNSNFTLGLKYYFLKVR